MKSSCIRSAERTSWRTRYSAEAPQTPVWDSEAGRQWQATCWLWLLSSQVGFARVAGVSQLFVLLHQNGNNVPMLYAKVTDDFLFSGCADDLQWFDEMVRKRFKVGKTLLDGEINFNGAVFEQNAHGDIKLSMEAYMKRAKPIPLDREGSIKAAEVTQYRGLAGTMNWAGRAAIPVACFAASNMQQKLGSKFKHI